MKHLITALVAIVCIIAGGVGGHFLRTGGEPVQAANTSGGEEGASEAGGHTQAEQKATAPRSASTPSANVTYYKFTREFVVPMIENGRVASLVILNINLEIDTAASDRMLSIEPAVRDNIMTTLISISNDGRTFETLSDIESYESMRALILMNLKKTMPDGIRNVLILDMARQDI